MKLKLNFQITLATLFKYIFIPKSIIILLEILSLFNRQQKIIMDQNGVNLAVLLAYK